MEAALTGISGILFVCFLLSVVWLSSLRGIRSCGSRHGLGSRLGLLGLFVFRFSILGHLLWNSFENRKIEIFLGRKTRRTEFGEQPYHDPSFSDCF